MGKPRINFLRLPASAFVTTCTCATVTRFAPAQWQVLLLAALILWTVADRRTTAWAAGLGHYVGFSFPLACLPYFDGSRALGITAWLGHALLMSSVFLIWYRDWRWRIALLPVVWLLLDILPPLGWLAWASPLPTAGVLFPGWGWIGLAVLFMAVSALAWKNGRWRIGVIAATAMAAGAANLFYVEPPLPVGKWAGLKTAFDTKSMSVGEDYQRLSNVKKLAHETGADWIAIPEGAIEYWTPAVGENCRHWQGCKVVMVCGTQVKQDHLEMVVGVVTKDGSKVGYVQRMPPPMVMWRPWRHEESYPVQMAGPATFEVEGVRIAPFICYEEMSPWVVMLAMCERPQVLVGFANYAPTLGTTTPRMQEKALMGWGRLFGVPIVVSSNSPLRRTP